VGRCRVIPTFSVILVEPKYSGNIGAIARIMMNFDVHQLILVNPCAIDDEAYIRSVHATSILDKAQIVDSFEEAIKQVDFVVGTSAIFTDSEKKHVRIPIVLEEFIKKIVKVDGTIGLVFGREDYGLYNNELGLCDMLVTIPTSNTYASLNLSHAVSLVLYRLYASEEKDIELPHDPTRIDGAEKRLLLDSFEATLDVIGYPEHKKEKTKVMFTRMMGRALPTKWEYHTLMGVFQHIRRNHKRKEERKKKSE
jgi:tRNA/rRNA methyltransferase